MKSSKFNIYLSMLDNETLIFKDEDGEIEY